MSLWNAKDAGGFFVKFYFCTIVIFLGCTHYLLLNPQFPKACALQDSVLEASGRSLCLKDTYNNVTETCSVDPLRASVSRGACSAGTISVAHCGSGDLNRATTSSPPDRSV